MDFNALQQAQEHSHQASQQRAVEAHQLYLEGVAAFARAADSQFELRQPLRDALDAWMSAIRLYHSDPKPYVALGYLFLLLDDSIKSVKYFKAAQELQADQSDPPDAALFLQYLSS